MDCHFFFITMTCNSDWPEITERLHPGQNAYDVPTIVIHAFKARLERLIHILNNKFGQLLYIIHIIEFQKKRFSSRSYPREGQKILLLYFHKLILLKVHPELPLKNVDDIIKAELPRNNPRLCHKIKNL
jgi:Helitron helicase-like domain at N-terminus